jgi:hypothetical protein
MRACSLTPPASPSDVSVAPRLTGDRF